MIKIDERFSSVLLVNNRLIPNTWDITVDLLPGNAITENYHTALGRVQFLLQEVLDNSLFVGYDDLEFLHSLQYPLRGTVHLFPDDPHDHLISICLYTKISSVLNKVFYVDRVQVSSFQGAGITHSHTSEDGDIQTLREVMFDGDRQEYIDYWYKSTLNYFDFTEDGLKLKEIPWEELDLMFEEDAEKTNVVKLNKFRPRIVPKDDDDDLIG